MSPEPAKTNPASDPDPSYEAFGFFWSMLSYLCAGLLLNTNDWLAGCLFFQASIVKGLCTRLDQRRVRAEDRNTVKWLPDLLVGLTGLVICLFAFLFEIS